MSYILNIEKIVYDVSANSEFEKIYLNAFREAVSDYPPKKLTSSDYDERRDKVNKAISSVNENNKIIAEKIAPKLHKYIRENGKPSRYPTDLLPHLSIPIMLSFDTSLPFNDNNVLFPFHYCAMQFEHFIGSNKSQYKNTEYETVELVPKPEIMHFKPSLRNDYDTEFGEMSRNIKECEALNEESQVLIDTLKEKYNESKSLFFCIIKTLAKFIFSVIKGLFVSMIPLIIAFVLCKLIKINTFDFEKICVYSAFTISFGIILWKCIKDKFWSPIKGFLIRNETKEYLDKIETAVLKNKDKINTLKNSADYKKALERNQKAYEADCKLAEEWQTEWYREYIRKHS